jgi:superfamily II DNA or RNA helicase
VGLGKTIEAGLLLAQKWAERKRRLLVIVPANLRKQWGQELADKFYLPSAIIEARSFNEAIRAGNLNPFQQPAVILCSYQFARSKEPYLRQTPWDLVVIDEAHRLRNVYKTSSKIALAIKQAVATFPKVLLTATLLQNTLLELYGLASIIDDFAFGDLKSYRTRFARLSNDTDFAELKDRLAPLCKRTLRRQVLEYVKYTNRHALAQEFVPSEEEQRLYDLVSDYIQRPTLYALPASQRQLMTLILRKLLASSTYAISATLEGLVHRLEAAATAAVAVDAPPEEVPADWEGLDKLAAEWDGDDNAAAPPARATLTPEQLADLRQEMAQLREFHALAKSIIKNAKGEVLLTAMRRGFVAAVEAQLSQGAATLQQMAVIFTESRRTQEYLFRLLDQTEFTGKLMLFNGTNNDPTSRAIYQRWLAQHAGTDRITSSPSADLRAALVEHFRDHAAILIATEAAAEGINLQFCNLVVNYDLPWNPQRIEQRIGRCHRYGQKFDVVVVNFLNKKNAADQRVYELLAEKFRLFSGVFGASDEVLGTVESGVGFEKRIAAIYQQCRTPEQIQFEFDQLQREMEAEISLGQRDAREKLLDNFDQEVVEKVRIESHEILDRFNEQLWRLTRHLLAEHAHFDADDYSFTLHTNPFPGETIHPGPYRMGKGVEDANTYRVGHPLAQRVLQRGKALTPPSSEVTFQYTESGKHIAVLESLSVGEAGWPARHSPSTRWRRRTDSSAPVSPTTESIWGKPNVGAALTFRPSKAPAATSPVRPWPRWTKSRHATGSRCWRKRPPVTAAGSMSRWISLTAGPRTAAPRSMPSWRSWTTRSRTPRRPPVWQRPCPRSWTGSAPHERSKPSARTPGGPMTRPVARSTGKKMLCLTRSAGGWSSASNKNHSSPCAGIWSEICIIC